MTYPFYAGTVDYAGDVPDDPAPWNDWSPRLFFIGTPGSMWTLPDPGAQGYTRTPNRGRQPHTLAYGATAVVEWPSGANTYTFSWLRLAPRERAFVDALDAGRMGDPPWCFVPPEDTNRLTGDQSFCVPSAWQSTHGAPTAAVGQNPAVPVPGAQVLQFVSTAANDVLRPGNATPDPNYAPPVIDGMPTLAAFYVWTPSATATVNAQLIGKANSSTILHSFNGPSISVGTTPRLVYAAAAAGEFTGSGSLYVLPFLRAAAATTVYVSNPLFGYLDDMPPDWLPGAGVPRVNPTTELVWAVDDNLNTASPYTLADAYTGAGL